MDPFFIQLKALHLTINFYIMGIKKGIEFYGKTPKFKGKSVKKDSDIFIPVSGKRSSVPVSLDTHAPNKLQAVPLDFPVQYLSTLENLAAYNDYISYAVDNIVQLANTPHTITFPDSVSEKQKKEMLALLKLNQAKWYANSGGIHSLKADLLGQTVINGALSAEHIPKKNLSGIDKVVRLGPKHIKFVFNRDTDEHEPHQLTNSIISNNRTGLLKLNTLTYKYIALRRYHDGPYGMPPFISAIESICTKKEMDSSFKNIMQKLGMLGFLSAEVVPPDKESGESQEDYWQRSIKYLSDVVYPQVEQNLSKGFVAGFKDRHSFKLEGNNMNVQGAEGLARLIKSGIFAGVKQDPNMLGSNEATTETFGRVILAKMLSQTKDYQKVVDRFFSSLYMLELRLNGYWVDYVNVESELPLVTDKVKEQSAESSKIDNVIKKRNAGIITQEDAAQELGYDEAAEDGDIAPVKEETEEPDPDNKTDPSGDGETTKNTNGLYDYILTKYNKTKIYPYNEISKDCYHATKKNYKKISNFKDPKMQTFVKNYFDEVYKKHKKASKLVTKKVGNKLLKVKKDAKLKDIQKLVYVQLIANWENEFSVPVASVSKANLSKIYNHFRKETKIFGPNVKVSKNAKSFEVVSFEEKIVPEAVLDLDDYRTINYLENSDGLYLGKYITDPDVKKLVNQYIKEQYLDGYLPIGNNKNAIADFQKTFSKELNLLGWKIRRIIDTTVNKARNYAHIHYLDQAEISKYEIIEVLDQLTCPFCNEMDGKTFNISATKEKIQKEVFDGPNKVSANSPFITTKGIAEIKKMSSAELQTAGFDCPPYHPHCRGTFVAVFDD